MQIHPAKKIGFRNALCGSIYGSCNRDSCVMLTTPRRKRKRLNGNTLTVCVEGPLFEQKSAGVRAGPRSPTFAISRPKVHLCHVFEQAKRPSHDLRVPILLPY